MTLRYRSPGVYFSPRTRTFTLMAKSSMYVMRVDDGRNLEHLYWGEALPMEDDLTYLSIGNTIIMFDPVGTLTVPKILGLDELDEISDIQGLTDRWKVYTKQKNDPERGSRPRRLENASWRLWTMERNKGGDLNRDLGTETLLSALGEEEAKDEGRFSEKEESKIKKIPTSPTDGHPVPRAATPPFSFLPGPKTAPTSPPVPVSPMGEHIFDHFPKSAGTLTALTQQEPESIIHVVPSEPHDMSRTFPSVRDFREIREHPRHPEESIVNWNVLDPTMAGKNSKLFEFADRGTGDYREPSIMVTYADGSTVSPFEYIQHKIEKGKPRTPEYFPNVRVEDVHEATTLTIDMMDPVTKLVVRLFYTVMHDYDIITRRIEVVNTAGQPVWLERLMSATVDFDSNKYYMTQLSGGWARERQIVTKELQDGLTTFNSCRGASSHQFNPFLVISVGAPFSETTGSVYGFNLIYSGNFLASAEVSESRRMRVNMGVNPVGFRWLLESGESFESPEIVLSYSSTGMGHLSRQLHRLYRNRLIPPRWRQKGCPILLNTWEAVYFKVNHEMVCEIARCCKNMGVELVVVDDGWFSQRNNEFSSLGDWYPNLEKFPFGLEGTVRALEEMGMAMGIWVEPEMVSVDSDLYREHSDWCLHVPERMRTMGRNQLVLDFSRKVVRDYIFEQLDAILGCANITYCKWDFNRHLTEIFTSQEDWPPERQGEIGHRFVVGVYEVFGRITTKYPDVLFESCSGGGGRFDPGMLYFTPQIWASDNTDAISRVYIQYGTSLAYPPRTFGSHVSTVPNHQTLRSTSMKTRSLVAMNGSFGYELDPRHLTDAEINECLGYVQLHQRFRDLVWNGDLFRLRNPFHNDTGAWMYVSEDQHEALVMAVNVRREVGRLEPRLLLQGLGPGKIYEIEELCPGKLVRNVGTGAIELDPNGVYQFGRTLKLSGHSLMVAGLPIKFLFDADSVLFHLKLVSNYQ
uniref:alpha-galactosidase n=1 Tax=Compsopogon caeruleus TaxID=31354 RepID=A0A7S1T4J5_9RHOD|mmetsp:Transcript_10289/g.20739  ORF Transcript_10289/g.20739 Transcript_10289/m.20739 type:complete len:972 (+) Transcript_10289:116-3031(+)